MSSARYIFMTPDMTSYYSGIVKLYEEEELARLIFILITPDPPTGASSTSTGSTYNALCGTITKDALLLLLEGIVQSSDAFPPLKSAASGLLFFASSADVSTRAAIESVKVTHRSDRWLVAIRNRSAISTSASRVLRPLSNAVLEQALRSLTSIKKSSPLSWSKPLH